MGVERFRGTAVDFPMTLLSEIYIVSSGCLLIDPFLPLRGASDDPQLAKGGKEIDPDGLILPQQISGRHPIFSIGYSSFFAIHCPFIFYHLPR